MSDEGLPAWAKASAQVRLDAFTSLEDLSPEWAWGGATGKGVRVAVVDSGIEADHPALAGWVDAEDSVQLVVDEEGATAAVAGPHGDAFGHGTACAGIVHDIAPEARLTSVKVLGDDLRGSAEAFVAGLAWAVERGFDVINVSLGTSRRDCALAFHEACDRAYFRNAVVVTAASNTQRPSYPSMYASVVSVACNLATDSFRFHFNPEPPTEFLARGVDVGAPWRSGGTIRATGNSYAAASLAGICALVRSKHPGLRPFQVKTILWATAANVLEAGRDVPSRQFSRSMARRSLW